MRKLLTIGIAIILFACSKDDNADLSPASDRMEQAIHDLQDKLTAPSNGWRLDYRPTVGSGSYLMLLKFNKDGSVNIKTDLPDNEGEFIDHTIYYRIDAALGLELIFETYGVFHYLFEKDQATFGAEFEFQQVGEQGDNLLFQSLSDYSSPTILELSPATANDESLLSVELAENLSLFETLSPQIFGGIPPIQQVILEDKNMSVFWSIDITRRVMYVDMAGKGTTLAEVDTNTDNVKIDHVTGFSLLGGKLVLDEGFTFTLEGTNISISEVALNKLSIMGASFCNLNPIVTPVYTGNISGVGGVTIKKSLFSSDGLAFKPMEDFPYTVNVLFVFDGDGNSLYENGSISNNFPDATSFVFNYGLLSNEEPANGVGFYIDDIDGESLTYLREFTMLETVANKFTIQLANSFYYSNTPPSNTEQTLINITDEIFEGGDIYIFELPVDNLTVFWLYNPCNQYELFLVQ